MPDASARVASSNGFRVAELGARFGGRLALDDVAVALDVLRHRELEELVRRVEQHEVFELAPVLDEALGFCGLALERSAILVDFRDDVVHAQQVLPREIHLALGELSPLLVLGDAGCLVDEQAAIFRTRADDLADASLLDDRVGLRADAGAEEKIGHVAQANLGLVDEVLARAVAEQAARHRDVRVVAELGRKRVRVILVRVVEGDGHLGETVRPARLGAVEEHVLHRPAAQVPRALLAEAPADGIDDVRLAAPVRADDGDHVVVEVDDRPVDERLEPRDL